MTPTTAAPAETAAPRTPTLAVRRLLPQAPVGVADAACLPYRLQASECRACIAACPTGALRRTDRRIEMGGDCLRCGRCEAACPSGALQVAGFAAIDRTIDRAVPVAGQAIRISCWKSPQPADAGTEAIRVPCLFGLSDARIVALRARTLPLAMTFVDHGWCTECSAGCGQTPSSRLAPAAALMRSAGLPESAQPKIAAEPLPIGEMRRDIPDAAGQRQLGRRAFFASLVRESLVPTAIAAASRVGEPAVTLRRGAASIATRATLIDGLTRIALACGGDGLAALPAQLFPRLEVTENCCHSGVCASHCPTAALQHESSDERGDQTARLWFDTSACIGCRHCVAVCPESALRFEAAGGYQPVTAIAETALQYCSECDRTLSGRTEEISSGLCGHCFRSRRLARSAFAQLFGARG